MPKTAQEKHVSFSNQPEEGTVIFDLEPDLERRLRVLAEKKDTTYQTLMKEFVLERVYEEEKRLGIV